MGGFRYPIGVDVSGSITGTPIDPAGDGGSQIAPSEQTIGPTATILVLVDFNDQGGFVDSTKTIPAGAKITRSITKVTQAFDGTTPTIIVGSPTTNDAYQQSGEIDATLVDTYTDVQLTDPPAADETVRVSVGGTGATQGQAEVVVEYTIPKT